MVEAIPHYLLMSEARATDEFAGEWRFVLESADGEALLEVDADETQADQERLDLLAVVRGLEALDQPSRVTLVTSSPYVNHGFRYGLEEWRENDWLWERFGEMTPIKNADLWRRVDRALRFHRVDCRSWRFDRAHAAATSAPAVSNSPAPPTTHSSFPASQPTAGSTSVADDANPAATDGAASSVPTAVPTVTSTVPAPHFRRSVSEDDGRSDEPRMATVAAGSRRASLPAAEARVSPRATSRRPAPTVRERPQEEYDNVRGDTRSHGGKSPSRLTTPLATAGAWLTRCRQWLVDAMQEDS